MVFFFFFFPWRASSWGTVYSDYLDLNFALAPHYFKVAQLRDAVWLYLAIKQWSNKAIKIERKLWLSRTETSPKRFKINSNSLCKKNSDIWRWRQVGTQQQIKMLVFEGGCVQARTSQGDRFRRCQEPMWACAQQLCNKTRIGETKGAWEHLLRPDDKWSSEMIVWPKWKFNVSAEQLGWQWPWWWDDAGPRTSAELRPSDASGETRGSHWSLQTCCIQPVSVEVTD